MRNHMHLFDLSPLSAFKCLLKSPAWIHVGCIWFFSTMCFQMCPHCENILTSKGRGRRSWRIKMSLYTLQADPEKSRDFIFPNPGIFTNWKSRDPGIPGIPLGPAQLSLISTIRAEQSLRWVGKSAVGSSRIWSSLTSWFLVDKIFRFINLAVRSWNAAVPSKIASRKFLRGSSFLLWKVDDLRLKIVNCSCET